MAPNPDKVFPNLPEDEQDMELQPVVMGPGAYGSPDPETSHATLLPLVDNPMATSEEGEGGAAASEIAAEDRKAADWKAMVEAAESEEALDALREEYDESGADFSTVEDAFDKKADELAEASNGS